jgi:hypothetical protein
MSVSCRYDPSVRSTVLSERCVTGAKDALVGRDIVDYIPVIIWWEMDRSTDLLKGGREVLEGFF